MSPPRLEHWPHRRNRPLTVAYLTSDGELVPVARYDGARWLNTWPAPIANDDPLPGRTINEIPLTWLGGCVPLNWTAWLEGTAKQHRIAVTGVDRDGSCFESITLSTNIKPQPPSDGLAFDRSTAVDRMVTLEPDSPELVRLRDELTPHFKTAVAAGFSREPSGGMGQAALARARLDPFEPGTLTVESGLRDPRLPIFFIEVMRRFDGIASDIDYDALSLGGWFRRDASGTLRSVSTLLTAMSSAEGKLPRYTPIGILRLGSASIWVMSEWGIESQSIVLFEVSATAVRTLTSAMVSGC